jgi:hypothetical protein
MMGEQTQTDDSQPDGGAVATVPIEEWIPHPVSDHGDLDRPVPVYGCDDLEGAEKEACEAALAEKMKSQSPEPPPPRRSPKPKK